MAGEVTRERDHADQVLEAIATIQATRALSGAIDCPACKQPGALRFHQAFRRGRGRARLELQAKCATPGCLEFRS
jgi:hypothetical protein